MSEPVFRGRLLSPDGKITSFVLRLSEKAYDDQNRNAILAHVLGVIDRHRGGDRNFWVTGNAPTRHAYLELLWRDTVLLLPLTTLVLAGAFYLTFRHWVGVLVPLTVIGVSQMATLAAVAWCALPITLLSVSVPVVLTVVGSSDAVHLLTRYGQGSAPGRSRKAALKESLERTYPALFVTSATTAAGFLALTTTGIPLLEGFGVAVALGIANTFLVTVFLAPPLLLCLPEPPPPPLDKAQVFARLGKSIARYPRPIAITFLAVVAVASFSGARQLRVESKIIDDVPPRHPIATERREVANRFGGTFPMTLLVHAREEKARAALDPEFLEKVAAFQRAIRSQEGRTLSSCLSIVDVYTMMWRGMGRKGELPSSPTQVKELTSRLPGAVLRELLVPGARSLRIDVWLQDRGTEELSAFIESAKKSFELTVGAEGRLEVQGFVYLAHKVHRSVVASALQGFVLSLAVVTLLLFLVFPSPREVVLAAFSNVMPAALTLGFMGWASIDLRIAPR